MMELIDTMENLNGELAEIVYEHGMFRAYEGYEMLAESDSVDSIVRYLKKLGFTW